MLRRPLHPRATLLPRLLGNSLDDLPPKTPPSQLLVDIKICPAVSSLTPAEKAAHLRVTYR
jgi:hypothetical protein